MISFKHKLLFTHPQKCGGTSVEQLIEQNDPTNTNGRKYKHWSLTKQINLIKSKGFNPDEFLKFSIIRNPWDRVVSGYHFAQRMKAYDPPISFEEYIEHLKSPGSPHYPEMTTIRFMYHQHSFALDFVIKLESIQEDIKLIQQHRPNFEIKNLPHKNSSIRFRKNRPYQHYYNTENKNLIEKLYEWDLTTFNYNFDSINTLLC
jgi:hypothetical protein